MSGAGELVFMASYQAATSYLKFWPRSSGQVLLLEPSLGLFGGYFSTYSECHVLEETSAHRRCIELVESLRVASITFWSYALSEIGLRLAKLAAARHIESRFILPSPFIDELYASNEFSLASALRSPRALLRVVVQRLLGYPVKAKTRGNYLYPCIDTSFASSVIPYREISTHTEHAEQQFAAFAAFVAQKYSSLVQAMREQPRVCILLDEDLEFLRRTTGQGLPESRRVLDAALARLAASGYAVYLKPTYYGEPHLSQVRPFDRIIAGEIPMEVLDMILPSGTLVTGFSSSFLATRMRNLHPVGISRIAEQLP
jgi:hypothetical protein